MSSRLRLTAALASALAVAAAVAPVAAPAASATPQHATGPSRAAAGREPSSGVPGVPYGAPKAALQAEPTLPTPSHAVWPFGEEFPRTSGTGRLGGGASFWSDFLYDDHGAASPTGFPLSGASMTSSLAPTQGIAEYPKGKADGNGADIFTSAVGVTPTATYWRVDWNTLADRDIPIAEWTFDTDNNAATGGSKWPAGAGVSSAGIDKALVVSAQHAELIDVATGAATDVTTHGGALSVSMSARSFIVRVPRTLLPVAGDWKVRLAAGLATSDGRSFAAPDYGSGSGLPAATLEGLPHVYNVTFRSIAQEPPIFTDTSTASRESALEAEAGALLQRSPLNPLGLSGLTSFVTGNFWNEDHQADVLGAGGDVSPFALTVDWSALASKDATPEPRPTGYSDRWYVSRLHLGQGAIENPQSAGTGDLRPNYLGRVQPYAVYVPKGVDLSKPVPLTWVLHSLSVNHNQYGAIDPQLLQQLCQDRHAICATTEGFGPDGWYFDEAEQDFWSVWHALATSYDLDTDHTIISGYSMGGWASFKLGLAHPDLFSEALPLEGPPVCGIRVLELLNGQTVKLPADSAEPGHCGADGDSAPVLGNARWLPYVLTQGGTEELVPAPSNLQTTAALDKLGERYTLFFLPEEDHLVYATQDRFGEVVKALGTTPAKVVNPPTISYTWFPNVDRPSFGIGTTTAYWLSGLRTTTEAPGALASVQAHSEGIADPKVTDVRTGPDPVADPLPALRSSLTWRLGAHPATHDRLALDLSKVSALTVDTARAGLHCPTVTTSNASATRLTLTRLTPGSRVRAAGRSTTVGHGGSATVSLPAGTSTTRVTCAGDASSASGRGGRDPNVATAAASPLPDTGGLGPVWWGMAALGLGLVVLRIRRGRRPHAAGR